MKEVFKCPNCGSSQTKGRIKTNDRICYTCLHTWAINKEDNTDG